MKNAGEDISLDEFFLFSSGRAQGSSRESVGIAQGTGCGLVQDGEGIGREDVLGGADASEASTQVIGGVVGGERANAKTMRESGVQGSVSSKSKSVFEVGQADEYERQQGFGVPLV